MTGHRLLTDSLANEVGSLVLYWAVGGVSRVRRESQEAHTGLGVVLHSAIFLTTEI